MRQTDEDGDHVDHQVEGHEAGAGDADDDGPELERLNIPVHEYYRLHVHGDGHDEADEVEKSPDDL